MYCVLPTSKSYVEPLLIDDSVIQKDLDFVLSAGKIDTKLPLYTGLVNGRSCSVLIDSGASANYISPNMLTAVTQFRPVKGQAVETANGHQSAISSIATFSLQLGDYKDAMEAYVFDTKFDLILGNSWLRQVQPIPDWFRSSWSIKLPDGGFTVINPIQQAKKFENVLNAQKRFWILMLVLLELILMLLILVLLVVQIWWMLVLILWDLRVNFSVLWNQELTEMWALRVLMIVIL